LKTAIAFDDFDELHLRRSAGMGDSWNWNATYQGKPKASDRSRELEKI
jgi:hypothetical protein